MNEPRRPPAKRRGAQIEPPNRFEALHLEPDFEQLEHADEMQVDQHVLSTQFIPDRSRSVLNENSSPDVGFRWSINPYRGCEHGCTYCYARPTHEMLGMNGGLDFETKIMVKLHAAELLREELARPSWQPEPITMSGVTDCYQPAERRFRITRACLEVLLEARQPVTIVTKNALILRDLDLLAPMAARALVQVAVSLTTLDEALARTMEPRTSPPRHRLRAIHQLSAAGVPVCALIAPVIPGLTDSGIPAVLQAAGQAGARAAGYVLLRLPWSVQPVFLNWLEREQPLKKPRIEALIRSVRSGRLNDPNFGSRMRGEGVLAEQIEKIFNVFAKKYGLDGDLPELDGSQFQPPPPRHGQLRLF
jgi:DNA repair photolyase